MATHGIFIAKSTLRLAPEWSFILLKNGHLTRDFLVCLASDRIVLNIDYQLSIILLWMRLTDVWMVSVDQDHAFPGQNPLQVDIRLGYSTVWQVEYRVHGYYALWQDRRGKIAP